jgi:hypothetical protein
MNLKENAVNTISKSMAMGLLILYLAGCGGAEHGTSVSPSVPSSYPSTIVATAIPTSSTYPGPGQSEASLPRIPYSGFEPDIFDANLKRDQVLLDLTASQLVMSAGQPVPAEVILKGNLPDSCHELRVIVTPPDAENKVDLEVYSLVKPEQACPAMQKLFSVAIPLGSFSPGVYNVIANGEPLGQFNTASAPHLSGYEPQPGDAGLIREPLHLDMETSLLVLSDTKPIQAEAVLVGTLPDACHKLRIIVKPPDAGGTISIQLYSVFDLNKACGAIPEPFNTRIPLGTFPGGIYTIIVSAQSSAALWQFDASYAPQPGDNQLSRGEVILDMSQTSLATTQGDWNLPAVKLHGQLPDACHQLRIVFTPDYEEYKVNLDVYSVFDPTTVCVSAPQYFTLIYPLRGADQSSVYVNGQFVDRFQWGG